MVINKYQSGTRHSIPLPSFIKIASPPLLWAAALLLAVAVAPVALAAGGREKDAPGYTREAPPSRERNALTVTMSGQTLELDYRKSYLASEAQFYTAIYEGLFSYHPQTMEPVPAAASRWELSDDKKVWTFTIRDNARYWNGDYVRAEDFRSAWLSLIAPGGASPYSSLFDIIEGARDYRTGALADEAQVGIEAPDDATLVVRLVSPAAFFASMLCHHSFSPLHPSMLTPEGWALPAPVSNGPYYLQKSEGRTLTLERNGFYWDADALALKTVTVKLTEDGDEASALWNSGEARWVAGEVNIDTLSDLSGVVVNPMFATHYYFIRSARKPWDDWRVRRALSLALPWDKVRDGHNMPAKTLVFPIQGYPEIEGVEADADEARRLLAEAGYPEGAGLPELVLRLNPSPESARIGSVMAEAWARELGVNVNAETVPIDVYTLKDGGYDVAASTWIGDFADPYTFLQMWRRDSNLNDALYDDPDYEALMNRSMTEEGDARWKTLSEAEALLLNRGTVLPISFSYAVNIIDTDEVGGWYGNVLDIHPFKYLFFKAFKPLPGVVMVN